MNIIQDLIDFINSKDPKMYFGGSDTRENKDIVADYIITCLREENETYSKALEEHAISNLLNILIDYGAEFDFKAAYDLVIKKRSELT